MDVPELLRQAARQVPAAVAVVDLDFYLAQGEWETALDVLLDVGDAYPATTSFWRTLGDAAHGMRLDRSAAWCAWRRRETLHGVIRAELRLLPGARRSPIPGAGRVRSLWNIGLVTPAGEPGLAVALIWVEYAPDLPPDGRGSVRLAPLTAASWRHLGPGDPITMHEGRAVCGAAVITEAVFPAAPGHRRAGRRAAP
ncbi:hypothetical protein ACFQFC_04610 [Amorphoplanes digitatis]|uniref:Uncharacterized protein n=1 Tax=Actinoplanes digitatis TaxID=1868 RepID=A0A7W7HZA5_9ACTN|nr:hypothetical protein [Actinoplanes digitatis]MBB4763469.1 hypothetical protein [Actinoplanes digitatis]BFE72586.1 hypothetical protein GCM10020092_058870 [Actinoplanes digitatis]GID92286.1 hypothetical protein Adi01nite_16980 [Actinoplanes digitatis]